MATVSSQIDKYAQAVAKAMVADTEFGRRANNHIRAISGHVSLMAYVRNGAPESEKESTLVTLLKAYRFKKYDDLCDPAETTPPPAPAPAAVVAPQRPTPDDFPEEAGGVTDDDPVEREEDDETPGGDIEDAGPTDPNLMHSDPREHQLTESANDQELQQALSLLGRAISQPKKAPVDEAKVLQIIQTAIPGIKQSTVDQVLEAVVTKLEFELAKKHAEISTEVGEQIAKFSQGSLQQAVIEALQSSVGQKISAGLQSGELEILPPLLEVDPNYVANQVSATIARAVKKNHHLIVSGPTGSGKTFPIEQELRKAGRRYLGPISLGDGLTKKDIIAREWLGVQEGHTVTKWLYGFLPRAMMLGVPLILDEISQAQKEVLTLIYYAMEYGRLHLHECGEVITAKPGFQIFGTDNALTDTTGLYSGFGLSIALTNRFKFVYSDYMDATSEIAIFERQGVCTQVATDIRTVLEHARKLYKSGEITFAPSTRTGKEIARDMAEGMTAREALDYNVAASLPEKDADKLRGCLSFVKGW